MLAADHLIEHISSNPLLARPLGAEPDPDGPRPQALVTYIARWKPRARWISSSCCPATAGRSPTTSR